MKPENCRCRARCRRALKSNSDKRRRMSKSIAGKRERYLIRATCCPLCATYHLGMPCRELNSISNTNPVSNIYSFSEGLIATGPPPAQASEQVNVRILPPASQRDKYHRRRDVLRGWHPKGAVRENGIFSQMMAAKRILGPIALHCLGHLSR